MKKEGVWRAKRKKRYGEGRFNWKKRVYLPELGAIRLQTPRCPLPTSGRTHLNIFLDSIQQLEFGQSP
ncbi:unnamed protein product [Cuscuta campestris]|uniref:Uncharacterized protein n=1 Tax=Cuscuta campestris TaxID=132261 RepID=A0A484N4G9_9ASTE|nr:unnamed protein product [Cuscuta campestris]